MSSPILEAVIFDLDGVLTDTARYHFLAWQNLAAGLGVPFDEAFNERLKGIDRMGSLELILAQSGRPFTSAEKQALADEKNRHYQALIAAMTADDLLPGALESLEAVRGSGLKVGLASVSKNAPAVLTRLGIASWFDYMVDAGKIANGKPHPEIFLTAAEHLEALPARCIGVEDSAAGIRSIRSAGMLAVGIGQAAVLAEADVVLPALTEFPAWLRQRAQASA